MDKEERNKIILEAAMHVFAKQGFADARMADIAQKAKMSYGLIYHYFKNKDEIFEAIIDNWWNELYNALDNLQQKDLSVIEKLQEIIIYHLNAYEKRPNESIIYVLEVLRGFLYRKMRHKMKKHLKFMRSVQDIIEEGQAKGVLRKDIRPHYLTLMFLGNIDAFLTIMIFGKEKITSDRKNRMIESMMTVFLKGAEAQSQILKK
jgi:TetR/AcrR family transcriptional regulator, fatty acid metabolism regulator protein